MWISIDQRLHFDYDGFVRESRTELRIQPLTSRDQTLHAFHVAVGPPSRVQQYRDWLGNPVHHFGILGYHDRVRVSSRSLVSTHPTPTGLDTATSPPRPRQELRDLLDFTRFEGPVGFSAALEELGRALPVGPDAGVGSQIRAAGALVFGRFRYQTDVSDYESTSHDLLETGAGVCQDFAHLTLALLRLRGVACRYVSGYLHMGDEQPAQSHAWIEAHTPEQGWLGFDPTHDRPPDERYVVVATGRSYDDVPPNRGVYRGTARETFHADVVTRESGPMEVATLQQELADLDVPVFQEIPHRIEEATLAEAVPEQEQQQQQ